MKKMTNLNISYETSGLYISFTVICKDVVASAIVTFAIMIYFDITKYLGICVKYSLFA
jgi:hypothetical protein